MVPIAIWEADIAADRMYYLFQIGINPIETIGLQA